ncbi:transcription factor TGA9 isoform X1 [Ziziphus jujuba]|uniref:Transcription factor TGA9 isoform X1 n=1 Tax=Ziziphus jujuba TaxID=326968 RepID=A0A6P6FWX7_ZIZJJ|nr:transcription factor TGA9 isoform X2 [Ziziphus jujuba var. spinosa]XP_060667775.1 transcription factor TGA9 isoform X1 [Ziziphus jujuba]XP_060667776.1 transcription factor TGA9 isoform X1 [Ziziphus jujuba]XP_060667777.1 transcription factor TGA9 isoform X1 [Ziziphus jujuba]XP_060667778.1 transcription factor TGA9 isoform X1 [Ziziphus jujuba]
MASHRVGETGLSDSGPPTHHHHVPYAVFHGINASSTTFVNQEGSAFDFGELEQAIALQGVKVGNDEAKASFFTGRPAATLEMFPSWPMRYQQTPRQRSSKSGGESTDSGSAVNTLSSKADYHQAAQLEPESPISKKANSSSDHQQAFNQKHQQLQQQQQQLQQDHMASSDHTSSRSTAGPSSQIHSPSSSAKPTQEKRKGVGSTSEKPLDAKTLRRLAQNREAARKSRLRKKAYVQQLESSRIKLTQLEQDLQRARAQGLFLGGCGGAVGNVSSGAAIFDMEYARWLEDEQRHMTELRTGLQAHLSDSELRVIVDGYVSHYDEIFRLKGVAAKSDVFHLITGMWTTPAERCFLWMGGFKPSELIKMLTAQLDPLTEQQVMGIYSLQHSSQQAEEALFQGLEQLQQSLIETIAGGPVVDGMQQMAVALGQLTNLEGFVRQADNLRQQTLHRLRQILTVRQAARCFLVIGEYYGRLRALSSLWTSRPRESMMSDDASCQTTTELQMVQPSHHHFSSF